MARDGKNRRKFVNRTRKKRPVGLALTRLGKIFKIRKHKD